MLAVTLKINYTDGRVVELPIRPLDQVRFEAKYGIPYNSAFHTKTLAAHLYYMAWSASDTDASFEDWLRTVADSDIVLEEEVVPFDPASSDGTSPDSPA